MEVQRRTHRSTRYAVVAAHVHVRPSLESLLSARRPTVTFNPYGAVAVIVTEMFLVETFVVVSGALKRRSNFLVPLMAMLVPMAGLAGAFRVVEGSTSLVISNSNLSSAAAVSSVQFGGSA